MTLAAATLPAVLTVPQVREILGVSLASTYEWINSGLIPSFRVGRRIHVKRAELERWLGSQGPAAVCAGAAHDG